MISELDKAELMPHLNTGYLDEEIARALEKLTRPEAKGSTNEFANKIADIIHRHRNIAFDRRNRAGAWVKHDEATIRRGLEQTLARLGADPAWRPRIVLVPLTAYQEAYNEQVNRAGLVSDNFQIEVSDVEQWLADNTESMLGVDTTQYTVFFINWYGRPDFKFHVYAKTDEPDPDTGMNFGNRETRKVIAWGGTTPDDEESGLGSLHRVWFYALSAGPEAWTDNWNVDDDFGYRMPPVWEYGNLSAYRPFDNLSGDLGKVTRYVALDLLFVTSPLYKPFISPPALPEDIQLDINVFQMDPAYDGTDYFGTNLIAAWSSH